MARSVLSAGSTDVRFRGFPLRSPYLPGNARTVLPQCLGQALPQPLPAPLHVLWRRAPGTARWAAATDQGHHRLAAACPAAARHSDRRSACAAPSPVPTTSVVCLACRAGQYAGRGLPESRLGAPVRQLRLLHVPGSLLPAAAPSP